MKKSIKTFFTISLLMVFAIFLSSNLTIAQGHQGKAKNAQGKTVVGVVNSNNKTSQFAQLLKKSGYSRILKKKGPYTVLAPTNKALKNANAKLKAKPKQLMRGQLFQGNVSKKQVKKQMGVKILNTDKSASNGTVYIVDKISQPQKSQQQKQ